MSIRILKFIGLDCLDRTEAVIELYEKSGHSLLSFQCISETVVVVVFRLGNDRSKVTGVPFKDRQIAES